jgi:hypothetical protein
VQVADLRLKPPPHAVLQGDHLPSCHRTPSPHASRGWHTLGKLPCITNAASEVLRGTLPAGCKVRTPLPKLALLNGSNELALLLHLMSVQALLLLQDSQHCPRGCTCLHTWQHICCSRAKVQFASRMHFEHHVTVLPPRGSTSLLLPHVLRLQPVVPGCRQQG